MVNTKIDGLWSWFMLFIWKSLPFIKWSGGKWDGPL